MIRVRSALNHGLSAVLALLLAVTGVLAMTAPVAAGSTRATLAGQGIPCPSLVVLRRELSSLARPTTDLEDVPVLLDSVIYRMSVILPRVPRVPGSTLVVLWEHLGEQRTEMQESGLSSELLARIRDTAADSNMLLGSVACT